MPLDDARLDRLVTYWNTLRKGRQVPNRAELDPQEFELALEHMFILEREPNGQYRFRLAGLALCEWVGMELRGESFGVMYDPAVRADVAGVMDQVLDRPCRATLSFNMHSPEMSGHVVLMPLRNSWGEINLILGCVGADALARPARLLPQARAFDMLHSQTDFHIEEPAPLRGFAEGPPSFERPDLQAIEGNPQAGQERPQSGRSHLRLVK